MKDTPKITNWEVQGSAVLDHIAFNNSTIDARYELLVSATDKPRNPLIAIGLNPCGKTDDKNFSKTTDTLRKIAFNNHYDGLVILNLCPLVTSEASELRNKTSELKDSVHQENLKHIHDIAEQYKESDALLCFGKALVKLHLDEYLKDICDALSSTNKNRRFLRLDAKRLGKPYANPPHPSRISPLTPLKSMNVDDYIRSLN